MTIDKPPTLIIVDTDAGVDDAWALLLLLSAKNKISFEIAGITCVNGNTSVDNVCVNILRTLDAAKCLNIPVYMGASTSLILPDEYKLPHSHYHGIDGFGDTYFEKMMNTSLIKEENAVVALNRIVMEHKKPRNDTKKDETKKVCIQENCDRNVTRLGQQHVKGTIPSTSSITASNEESGVNNKTYFNHTDDIYQISGMMNDRMHTLKDQVSLLCLGPLTNIALAIRTFPSFQHDVRDIYFMGGNYQGVGNTTNAAEFNFWADPEAAQIVLSSEIKIKVMLPWETCTTIDFPLDWRNDILGKSDNDAVQLMNKVEQNILKRSCKFWKPADELIAAYLVNKNVASQLISLCVTVELHGMHTRGQAVVCHKSNQEPNVHVITGINKNEVERLLLDIHSLH